MSFLLSVDASTAAAPCNRGEPFFLSLFRFNATRTLPRSGAVNISNTHRSKRWVSEFNLDIPSVSRVSIHDLLPNHFLFFIPAVFTRLQ